jgi:hypothetical protein
MDAVEDIESILYIAREVSGMFVDIICSVLKVSSPIVYKIPPRNANEGYRATDWGDLGSPLWKGRLRIIENSKGAALHLEDSQTGVASLGRPV